MIETNEIDPSTIKQVIVTAMEETLRRDLSEIDDDTRLFDELSIGSTGVLMVLVSLEKSLGISVDPETITEDHLATLGGLVECVLATARES
ncbi:acyl carrier protein [Glycomyces xiaoerkulensis]|uniref:acyl carrier protein n=1 Tax=Glycomyces xiaoerkulensis TaxID=2038139 RepID=UPI0018E4503B|nr:acyl carrier protein [Glycomyces xiaoerkulensis]